MFVRAFTAVVLVAATAVPVLAWPACGNVASYPAASWGEADPTASGWNAAELSRARDIFASQPSAAVMVVHQGRLIANWGTVERRYTAQSVRKALLNSLVGDLVQRRRLRLTDTLAALGIDDLDPRLTAGEKTATVKDLLGSRSGIFHTALYEVRDWKSKRMALANEERQAGRDLFPAGAYWIYNNWDFNVLGTIVEKRAGMGIGPFFAERIASPLQMQDFRPEDVEYTTSEHPAEKFFGNVSMHRAYVFNISTRDLARYGLLFLGCGGWKGDQVLERSWVLESVRGVDTRNGRPADRQVTGFGDYGYLWAVDRPGARRFDMLRLRDPFFFAEGARGHFMLVFPSLDLVIAHQVATEGGVSPEAQMRRAKEGSPMVSDDQFQRLVAAIIAAHPQAKTALADPGVP